ncbi:MAG: flagellin [Deltaproteobacteria bacterium]|nr:flagellin [Deltaproteobacteria bacterium]
MGFRIQNNIAAMNAQKNLGVSDSGMSKSLERLSSGYRINSAKDDAAGLAISQSFRADIASVKVAQRNITEANSLLQVAEGAMSSVGDILTRMKELATQAASANVGTDISKVASEYNTLVSEIDRIADSTKYAGTKLVDGTFSAGNTSNSWNAIANIYDVTVTNAATGAFTVTYTAAGGNILSISKGSVTETKVLSDAGGTGGTVNFSTLGVSFKYTGAFVADTSGNAMDTANLSVTAGATAAFQVGYESDTTSQLTVALDSIKTGTLGLASGDLVDSATAYTKLATIDNAIDTLAASRGDIGAYQNRLGYAATNLSATLENFTAAESVIRDVDMAAEMTTFTKNQILVQAGTAMLAQANMAPQQVLSLLK